MATRINLDPVAHDLNAKREEMWRWADKWFKEQPLAVVDELLEMLHREWQSERPDALLYRLAFTALIELAARYHVALSQAESVACEPGECDDGN